MNWFKIFLFLVSFLGNNILFAMQEEEGPSAGSVGAVVSHSLNDSSETLTPLLLKINSWTQEVPYVFVHFYWSVGRLPEMVPEDQRGPIRIGGPQYGDVFFEVVSEFLNFVPEKVNVVMTCDLWTYKTNKAGFDDLQKRFNKRFLIQLIDAAVEKLKDSHPRYEQTLETVFQNACCGNPAIASDIYRLLLNSFHQEAPKGCTLVYLDIDLFCESITGNKEDSWWTEGEFEIFMENLFNPQFRGYFSGRNDFIKFVNTFERRIGDKVLEVLTLNLRTGKTIIPHFSTLINFLKRFERADEEGREAVFQDYLRYSQENCFCARDVISATGPGLVKHPNFGIPALLQRYGLVSAVSWYDPGFEISQEMVFNYGFIPNTIAVKKMEALASCMINLGLKDVRSAEKNDTRVLMEKGVLKWQDTFQWSTPAVKDLYSVLEKTFSQGLQETQLRGCQEYKKLKSILSDLGFVKKFGENHPFYQRLKMWILDGNRYFNSKSSLAEVMRLYYAFDNAQQAIMDKKSWAEMIMYQIDSSSDAAPKVIQKSLNMLGSDFTLSVSDIMEMVESF